MIQKEYWSVNSSDTLAKDIIEFIFCIFMNSEQMMHQKYDVIKL